MRALLIVALLAGCASSAERPQAVQPITEAAAASCAYMDDITAASGWYGVFAERGITNARASAIEKAQAMGANAVVWTRSDVRYGSTSVSARAYRCPR